MQIVYRGIDGAQAIKIKNNFKNLTYMYGKV